MLFIDLVKIFYEIYEYLQNKDKDKDKKERKINEICIVIISFIIYNHIIIICYYILFK